MERIFKILIGFLCVIIGGIFYIELDLTCMNSCAGCGDSLVSLYVFISYIIMAIGILILLFGITDE